MGAVLNSKDIYRFGPFSLDPDERVLLRDGEPVTLPPKDLETLLVLVQNAGHIVEKDELLRKVWPGVFIEEGNLSRRVFNLRQVLGEGVGGRPYIETIPKRGYRFVPVDEPETSAPAPIEPSLPSDSGSFTPPEGPHRRRWLWPLAASIALAFSAILAAQYFWPVHPTAQGKIMLAVLPFENLTGNPQEDYFSDGLTEEMITQLGQMQPSQMGVIARTSILRYKKTKETAAQIGHELGVGYLLEGSVRRGGERVRITAQLIRTTDQTHVWAETYDRPLTDVLNVQREIGEKVTRSLSLQLLPTRASSAEITVNIQSYDKYLLGLHDLGQGTREGIEEAIGHFQAAIVDDPNDARLYAALGEAYEASNTYYRAPMEAMPRVKEAAERALQLDPNSAAARVLLGDVHLLFEWNWVAAEKEYLRALEINPSLPQTQLGYATYLATLGRSDEALSHVQEAYLFDPLAIDTRNNALWIYYFSGRMKDTLQQARKANELEPSAGLPYAMLAMVYAEMGKRAETQQAADLALQHADSPTVIASIAAALAQAGHTDRARGVLDRALQQARQSYICRFIVAGAYTQLGDKDRALESLEQGYLQHST